MVNCTSKQGFCVGVKSFYGLKFDFKLEVSNCYKKGAALFLWSRSIFCRQFSFVQFVKMRVVVLTDVMKAVNMRPKCVLFFFLDAEKINYSPYFIQLNFWFHRQRCILTSDVLAVKKVEPFF